MPESPLPNALPPYPVGALTQGCHSGLPPYLLGPQQCSFAVNVSFRGGYATSRPPLWKLVANYASEGTQSALKARFQGAAFYRSIGNNPSCLVASVGGRLFRWTPAQRTVKVDEITPFKADGVTLDVNDPLQPQVWMAQGQDFLVVNDGQSEPYIFDGASVKRSLGHAGKQLPPGRQVFYSNGRFIVVLADPNAEGIAYIASDLVYNTGSGTAAYNYRDSILYINDNLSILGGRAFAVPVTAGPITALFSTAVSDTSLGQGPLQVATGEGIYSVDLPLDATLWTTTQQPTQVVALPNGGPTGGYAVTTVNGDAWYRALDGLRSFVVARRDFNTWVQTPLSFEMARIMVFDQQNLLQYASVVNFNNRLLCTCSPYTVKDRGVAHRGLVALDYNNISSLTTRSQPAYDGLWTGLPVLQVVKGRVGNVDRCFVFALDGNGDICLYELGYDEAAWFDNDGAKDVGIASYIESAALYGRDTDPIQTSQVLKRIEAGDLYWESLIGPNNATPPGRVAFNVQYRSDQWPFWVDWAVYNACAQSCYTPVSCTQPRPVQTQYTTYQRLPVPASVCNQLTGRPFREGYTFQVKLSWVGHATLHRFNFWCIPAPATRNVVCGAAECRVVAGCLDNPFSYHIEIGGGGGGGGGVIEWDYTHGAPTFDVPAASTIIVT